jgi:hypothetical protein
VLIVFTSRPYRRSTPTRFARVVRAERDDDVLRLHLELGSRARTTDPKGWQAWLDAGPNPSEQSEIWLFRTDEDRADDGGRVPVAYASPEEDERAWRDTIAELAPDDDYRNAVFLRVDSVRAADATAAPALESPYRLSVERPYLVRIASLNPHLSAETLRDARLGPVYDELATAVVVDEPPSVPADGMVDVLVSPIVPGPGWLELDVALGLEVVAATSLGWVAEGAGAAPGGHAERPEPAEVAEPLELPFPAPDPIAEAAVRAYAIAAEAQLPPNLLLRLLGELRTVAPDEARLAEAEGLARYDASEYEAARATLDELPLDALGPRGRATLVAATLRLGRLPDPIERVRMADLWRPETAALVLDASGGLSPDDQLRLADFVGRNLLSEERAQEWDAAVRARLGLVDRGTTEERR